MRKFLFAISAFIVLACAGQYAMTAGAAAYPSVLVGGSPSNGYVLQTNGTASTWVATSSLGITGGATTTVTAGNAYLLVQQVGTNATLTPISVLSVQSSSDIAPSSATGTAITFQFLNPKNFTTTTVQSVLNALSATGLATYNSSTGVFNVSSSSLNLGTASQYNKSDVLPSSTAFVSSFNNQTGSVFGYQYDSVATLGSPLTIDGTTSSTITGDGTPSYIPNFNGEYHFPSPTQLSTYGCMGSSTISDAGACLNYIYSIAPTSPAIYVGPYSYTVGSSSADLVKFSTNGKYIALVGQGTASTQFTFTNTTSSSCGATFNVGNAKQTGWGSFGILWKGPNTGTSNGVCTGGSNGAEGFSFVNSQVTHFYNNWMWGDNTYFIVMDHSIDNFNVSGGSLVYMNASSNSGETMALTNASVIADGQPAAGAFHIQTSGVVNIECSDSSFDDAQYYADQYDGNSNTTHFQGCHFENPAGDSIPAYDFITTNSGNPNMSVDMDFTNVTFTQDAPTHVTGQFINAGPGVTISGSGVSLQRNSYTNATTVTKFANLSSGDLFTVTGLSNFQNAVTYAYGTVPVGGGIVTNQTSSFQGQVTILSNNLIDASGNPYVTSTTAGAGGIASTTPFTANYLPVASSSNAITNSAVYEIPAVASTSNTPVIAFDTISTSSVAASTTLTYPFTVTSTANPILFVGATGATTDVVTGATYNGSSMTLAAKVQVPSDKFIYLFYLANPTSGTHNVVVTANTSTAMSARTADYAGAASVQPDGVATSTHSSVTSSTISITTSKDNAWAVVYGKTLGNGVSAATGTIMRQGNSGTGFFDSNGVLTPSGAHNLSVAINPSDNFGEIAMGFDVAPSSSTPFVPASIGINTTTPSTALDVNGDITDENVKSASCVGTNATGTLISASCASGGGLTGNSTSTYIAVYNTSGTLAGYTTLTYTSSTNIFTVGTSTIQGSGSGDTLTMNGAGGYTLLNGNNGWGINAQADYLRLVAGGTGNVELELSTDNGISRDAAGVLDFGNGTYQDKTGSINLASGTFSGTVSSTQICLGGTCKTVWPTGGSGSSTIITGVNGVNVTQVGVNATASLDTTYAASWSALETFLKGATINGTTTFASTTNALLYTDSSGILHAYLGSGPCPAGQAMTGQSATGTQTCSAFLTAAPATTTINGVQSATFRIVGDGTTVTSTLSGATTTFSIINTGNWAGTWQGVNSSTFYLASNPNGYLSTSTGLTSANFATTSVSQWANDAHYVTSSIINGYSTSTGANPSTQIGTSVVNGSANTFMRSDAAPTINQAATFSFSALGNTTSTANISASTIKASTSITNVGVKSALVLNDANGLEGAYGGSNTSGGSNCLTGVTLSATGTLSNTNGTCSGGAGGGGLATSTGGSYAPGNVPFMTNSSTVTADNGLNYATGTQNLALNVENGSGQTMFSVSSSSVVQISNVTSSLLTTDSSGNVIGIGTKNFYVPVWDDDMNSIAYSVTTANKNRVTGIYISDSITFSTIGYFVNALDASTTDKYDLGFYDINGNLLADIGATSLTATGMKFSSTTQGSMTFNPGLYYFAFTGVSTTAKLGASNLSNIYAAGTATQSNTSGGTLTTTSTVPTQTWGVGTGIPQFMLLQ